MHTENHQHQYCKYDLPQEKASRQLSKGLVPPSISSLPSSQRPHIISKYPALPTPNPPAPPHPQQTTSDAPKPNANQTKTPSYLLNIIIRQRPPILQLFPSKDQSLLIRRDALFVLDLGFHIVDCVGGFDFEGDGFAGEGFDEAGLGQFVGVGFWGKGEGKGRGRVAYICTGVERRVLACGL